VTPVELGKRARACNHFRWMPGMRATEEAGGYDPHLCEADFGFRRPDDRSNLPYAGDPEAVPDLNDPATLGCILALVREAWADPRIHAAPALYSHESPPEYQYTISHWHVYSPGPYDSTKWLKCDVVGKTEAEALVKALEAAP